MVLLVSSSLEYRQNLDHDLYSVKLLPSGACRTAVTVPALLVSVLVNIDIEPLLAYCVLNFVDVAVRLVSVLTMIWTVPTTVGRRKGLVFHRYSVPRIRGPSLYEVEPFSVVNTVVVMLVSVRTMSE